MPSSCALLGEFAIGARAALLWQHNANAKCYRGHACTRSMPSCFLCVCLSTKSTNVGSSYLVEEFSEGDEIWQLDRPRFTNLVVTYSQGRNHWGVGGSGPPPKKKNWTDHPNFLMNSVITVT